MCYINELEGIGKIFNKFPDLDLNIEFSDSQQRIIREANDTYGSLNTDDFVSLINER